MKRLTDAEILAARRAGSPPVMKEDCAHPLDDWHAAQESWLERWRPAAVLSDKKGQKRSRAWEDLVKMHARHFKVRHLLAAPRSAAPPLPHRSCRHTLPCTRACA